jgi:hypothetical protein
MIEDPSLGPGRVDFRDPDGGFGLEGTPNLRKGKLICGPPLYNKLPGNEAGEPYK